MVAGTDQKLQAGMLVEQVISDAGTEVILFVVGLACADVVAE